MPSFSGLFSRKKSKLSSSNNSSNGSSPSPTTVYISPDKSLPSSPNGIPTSSVYPSIAAQASSSKLRLPFTRKKYNPATSTTSIATHSQNHPSESQSTFGSPSPPRPSYLTRTSNVSASDSDTTSILDHRRLRPPPSKSAIFAAYADPHIALSTRSLPDDRSSSRRPVTPPPPLPLQVPPPSSKDRDKDDTKNNKKTSFFHWGSKSTPNTPLSAPHEHPNSAPATQNQSPHYVKKNLPDSPTEDKSFNLKAFRHISNGTNNESDVSGQGMGAPRPRGTSITSESSQRISVAAFREAQARRSTADSPVPSFRAPSPGPGHGKGMAAGSGFSSANNSPFGSPNLSSRSPRESLQSQNQNYRLDPKRRSSNLAFTSESDESSSEEEEEDSDDDIRSTSVSQHRHKKPEAPIANTSNKEGLNRQRTVTKRNSGNTDDRPHFRATKSESGHMTSSSSSHAFPGRNHSFTPSPAAPPVPPPPPVSMPRSWLTGGKQIFGNGNGSDAQTQKSREEPQPRSQSSLGFTSSTRKRASMSVSAIMPNAAAKRASVIVADGDFKRHFRDTATHSDVDHGDGGLGLDFRRSHVKDSSTHSNPKPNPPSHSHSLPPSNTFPTSAPPQPSAPTHKPTTSTSTTSTNTTTTDSEDDAPLALLMQPRRPGSALSHASNARSISSTPGVNKPKPLIDINELTGAKSSSPTYMQKAQAKAKANDVAFTGGATLISSGVGSTAGGGTSIFGGKVLTSSPTQLSPPLSLSLTLTSTSPPTKFVSPPASPVKEAKEFAFPPQQQGQGQGRSRSVGPVLGSGVPISERLSRIMQSTVGGGGASGSSSGSGSGSSSGSGSGSMSGINVNDFPSPPPSKDTLSKSSLPRLQVERQSLATPVTSEPSSPYKKPQLSPPDQGLMDILGGSISLISRTGESESGSESESDYGHDSGGGGGKGWVGRKGKEKEREREKEKGGSKRSPTKLRKKSPVGKGNSRAQSMSLSPSHPHSPVSDLEIEGKEKEKETLDEREEDRIAPIPIKQRAPTPSFSVTSRPVRTNTGSPTDLTTTTRTSAIGLGVEGPGPGPRQRSSTMLPSPTSSSVSGVSARHGILASPTKANNLNRGEVVNPGVRQRSSTMLPGPISNTNMIPIPMPTPVSKPTISSTSSATLKVSTSPPASASASGVKGAPTASVGSSSFKPSSSKVPVSSSSSKIPTASKHTSSSFKNGMPPPKPFAANAALRRESPASSTGDSSSGRAPFTPRDGSEVGSASASASMSESMGGGGGRGRGGLKRGVGEGNLKHMKRRSVSFEEDLPGGGGGGGGGVMGRETGGDVSSDMEERRRERRRSEAKAAIELGNVINGRGPIVNEDDDEDDLPINQTMTGSRLSAVNPMMGMGGPSPMQMQMPFGSSQSWNAMNPNMNMNAWQQQQQMQMQMQNPQMPFMAPGADPNFIAAHQQAMMFAKQAYQMAVAQQAMAAAGDEWERGSSIGGGFGGGSVYGGGASSVMRPPSFAMGMGGGMGMGMGMGGMGNGWSTGSAILPPSSRSMYGGGFSGARSEYGGGGGGGGGGGAAWNSSRSSYGELGPSKGGGGRSGAGQRNSGLYPPMPPVPQGSGGGGGSNAARGTPRSRTTSQPSIAGRGTHRPVPPSSWKSGVGDR